MSTKEEFHHLIDSINDEQALKVYYELVRMLNHQEGKLMATLDHRQKEELTQSYEGSFEEESLVSHEEMKRRNAKWL